MTFGKIARWGIAIGIAILFFIGNGVLNAEAATIFENLPGGAVFGSTDEASRIGYRWTADADYLLGQLSTIRYRGSSGQDWYAFIYEINAGILTLVATSSPITDGGGTADIQYDFIFPIPYSLENGQEYFFGFGPKNTDGTNAVRLDASGNSASPFRACTYNVSSTTFTCPFGGGSYAINIGAYTGVAPDDTTRIISFTPEDGFVATSTGGYANMTFTLHAYINPEDVGSSLGIKLTLHNIDQNVLFLSSLSPSDIYLLDSVTATTSGDFYFTSAPIPLPDGNYRINAIMERSILWGFFVNPFSSLSQDLSHQFIVGQGTFLGNISQNSYNALSQIFASTTATSTANLAKQCVPLGDFDAIGCLGFLFWPDMGLVNDTLNNFRMNVAGNFPLGYVTDFIGIMSTTTEGNLPVIDAIIPAGLPGTGSHLSLSLNNVLDPILYATTSNQFRSGDADDPRSLYEITSYYWEIIVNVMAVLYILARIFGSHLFGGMGPHDENAAIQVDIARNLARAKQKDYKKSFDRYV